MSVTREANRGAYAPYSGLQFTVLLLLRVAIGWHFLYEGISKLWTPGWTSQPFLELARWGFFADVFRWIAAEPAALLLVDLLNVWGLILIGAGLMLGFFTRVAAVAGMLLLTLYYLAHPPLVGFDFGSRAEGSYLVVDKNLVEILALAVTAFFPTGAVIGLDRLIRAARGRRGAEATAGTAMEPALDEGAPARDPTDRGGPDPWRLDRREVLKSLATLPVVGGFVIAVLKKRGWDSYEEQALALVNPDAAKADAVSSATTLRFSFTSVKDLKGQVPKVPIAGKEFSRIILGGNLIGGWAHARDLIYVSKLVKAYHHDQKVFETLYLAEKCGINALLTNPILCRVINAYWDRGIGKIQFISDCGQNFNRTLLDSVKLSIEHGASACYVQGETADRLVKEDKVDLIAEALEYTREKKLPAGIGAHRIETLEACAAVGLKPDFWMKTFHHHNYWSAKASERHDNMYCERPEATAEFMKSRSEPWIAFKTLAAGAIKPEDGFRYALENGADFLCVGMYDFQIVDDVNLALDLFSRIEKGEIARPRPWEPAPSRFAASG